MGVSTIIIPRTGSRATEICSYCTNMSASSRYQFRVILIGDSTVGKTSLLYRMKDKTGELPIASTTIGVDFHTTVIHVNGVPVNFQLWDTAGQEDFRSITVSFFRNAVAGFLVFDVTNRESFDHLNVWITEAKSKCNSEQEIVLLLVGNKADLERQREVSHDEAQCFADQHNIDYVETSAKSGTNVYKASMKLTEHLLSLIEGGKLEGYRTWDENSTTTGLHVSSAMSSSFAPTRESDVTIGEKKQGCCHR